MQVNILNYKGNITHSDWYIYCKIFHNHNYYWMIYEL